MRIKYSQKEIEILLKNIVVCVDSREQVNEHVIEYLKTKKYVVKKLDQGDYAGYIQSNEETLPLGITRDLWFDDVLAIERKNSVDELVQSIKDRKRFEDEFKRLKELNTKTLLLVEDENGYSKILKKEYRSQYDRTSLIASLETLLDRYDISLQFIDKRYTGFKIYAAIKYNIRNELKRGI